MKSLQTLCYDSIIERHKDTKNIMNYLPNKIVDDLEEYIHQQAIINTVDKMFVDLYRFLDKTEVESIVSMSEDEIENKLDADGVYPQWPYTNQNEYRARVMMDVLNLKRY